MIAAVASCRVSSTIRGVQGLETVLETAGQLDIAVITNAANIVQVNSTTEFKNTVPATGVDIPSLIFDYLISSEKR